MRALDQLLGLRALMAPNGTWLPGYSFGAVDGAGRDCPTRAPEAVRFGLLAGLTRIDFDTDERLRAVDILQRAIPAKPLYAWEQEPSRTETEVREAVERAIALEIEGDRP